MPPRKPLSSRAPLSRRGGRAADRSSAAPPPPEDEALPPEDDLAPDDDAAGYQTGSDYPAGEDEAPDGPPEDAPLGEDDLGRPTARYRAGEDIYGEDEPWPDEDEPAPPRRATRGVPPVDEVTRIGEPTVDPDDGDEDTNATRAGPPIHVEVVSGPDQGRKKRFRGVRMVIGRAQGCDFTLADTSVSRRHLELVLGDDGVLLRDLGSGNGTRVNGEKVSERALLDGDEVALGSTRFRFVDETAALRKLEAAAAAPADEAAPAAPARGEPKEGADEGDAAGEASGEVAAQEDRTQTRAPAPPRRGRPERGLGGARQALAALEPRQRLIMAGAAGAVVLLAVLIIATGSGGPPPPPPPDPRDAQVALALQQARAALADGRFAEAVALLEEAERTKPGADESGFLDGARREAAAQRALDEARALAQQGEFDRARALLDAAQMAVVVDGAAKSKVRREVEEAEFADRRRRVEDALAAQDVVTAELWFNTLPRKDQVAFGPRIDELRERMAAWDAEEKRRQQQSANQRKQVNDAQRRAELDVAFEGVRRRFDAGEWSRAGMECDRVIEQHRGDRGIRERAAMLKRTIPQFGRHLDEAQKKIGAGNLEGAAAPLQKARELLRQIAFPGGLASDLDDQLAKSSLAAAGSAISRGDLASAARHYRQALALTPGDAKAKGGLEKIYRSAEDLYLEAYIIRDRDPRAAGDKFRLVMDILPKDQPTWGRAQTQLGALGQ